MKTWGLALPFCLCIVGWLTSQTASAQTATTEIASLKPEKRVVARVTAGAMASCTGPFEGSEFLLSLQARELYFVRHDLKTRSILSRRAVEALFERASAQPRQDVEQSARKHIGAPPVPASTEAVFGARKRKSPFPVVEAMPNAVAVPELQALIRELEAFRATWASAIPAAAELADIFRCSNAIAEVPFRIDTPEGARVFDASAAGPSAQADTYQITTLHLFGDTKASRTRGQQP